MNNQELEELSFRNLIWFHQDELRRIHKGEAISSVMPCATSRRPLYKHGVLVRSDCQMGTVMVLTESAIRVLENVEV